MIAEFARLKNFPELLMIIHIWALELSKANDDTWN